MQRWEHILVSFDPKETEEQIMEKVKRLGSEGWEMTGSYKPLTMWFKRPRPDEETTDE